MCIYGADSEGVNKLEQKVQVTDLDWPIFVGIH